MATSSAPAAALLAGASLPLPLSARTRSVRLAALPRAPPPLPALRLSLGPRTVRCLAASGGIGPDMRATLDKVVAAHKVVLFMKGTKEFPQCGFSHTVVQILRSLDVPFKTLDVLANEALRQGLKEYSSWPTFPQLYIDGEFFSSRSFHEGAQAQGTPLSNLRLPTRQTFPSRNRSTISIKVKKLDIVATKAVFGGLEA